MASWNEDPDDLAAAFFARQSERERAKTILPIDDWNSIVVEVAERRRIAAATTGGRRCHANHDYDHDDDHDDDHGGDEDDVDDDDDDRVRHLSVRFCH